LLHTFIHLLRTFGLATRSLSLSPSLPPSLSLSPPLILFVSILFYIISLLVLFIRAYPLSNIILNLTRILRLSSAALRLRASESRYFDLTCVAYEKYAHRHFAAILSGLFPPRLSSPPRDIPHQRFYLPADKPAIPAARNEAEQMRGEARREARRRERNAHTRVHLHLHTHARTRAHAHTRRRKHRGKEKESRERQREEREIHP